MGATAKSDPNLDVRVQAIDFLPRVPGEAALNAVEELPYYYLPWLEKQQGRIPTTHAPGNCSAIVATGSYTKDHRIVMGHNTWTDYVKGSRWNIIFDIKPQRGYRILMDGLPGVILTLPFVALGGYGLAAMSAGLAVIWTVKLAENATDYSVMNTGRQLLWLPTRREEKYKAKQTVDTFFVRTGDVVSALLVAAGVAWLGLQPSGFAVLNVVLVVAWLVVAVVVLRENRRVVAQAEKTEAA